MVWELRKDGLRASPELFDHKWQAEAEAQRRAYSLVEMERRLEDYQLELARFTFHL